MGGIVDRCSRARIGPDRIGRAADDNRGGGVDDPVREFLQRVAAPIEDAAVVP